MVVSERALDLLQLAQIDLKAALILHDSDIEFVNVVGFHLQQAAEKALKAWLDFFCIEYPKTHDLMLLLTLIPNQTEFNPQWWDLSLLMPFAVNLRYDDDLEEYIELAPIFDVVKQFLAHVDSVIRS